MGDASLQVIKKKPGALQYGPSSTCRSCQVTATESMVNTHYKINTLRNINDEVSPLMRPARCRKFQI